MIKKLLKNQSGLSMPEVMIAFFILTMGLLGVMSLVVYNVQVNQINKNSMIASGLAQEGIELVRNIRDSNWYNDGLDWAGGLASGAIKIDYDGNKEPITSIDEGKLYFNGEGFYTIIATNNTEAPFYRMVTLTKGVGAGGEEFLEVTSHVEWRVREDVYKYEASSVLYDWR